MENKELIKIALDSKAKAYTPYSNFNVGAAVLMEDGQVYSGCNIEIASYSPTICAERTAIFKAISEGNRRIKKIAVVGDSQYTFPCGVCRQVMREFANPEEIEIIIGHSVDDFKLYSLEDLLPNSFGPDNLKK